MDDLNSFLTELLCQPELLKQRAVTVQAACLEFRDGHLQRFHVFEDRAKPFQASDVQIVLGAIKLLAKVNKLSLGPADCEQRNEFHQSRAVHRLLILQSAVQSQCMAARFSLV